MAPLSGATTTKSKRSCAPLFALCAVLCVLGLALGVGLGVGLPRGGRAAPSSSPSSPVVTGSLCLGGFSTLNATQLTQFDVGLAAYLGVSQTRAYTPACL